MVERVEIVILNIEGIPNVKLNMEKKDLFFSISTFFLLLLLFCVCVWIG